MFKRKRNEEMLVLLNDKEDYRIQVDGGQSISIHSKNPLSKIIGILGFHKKVSFRGW